MTLGEGASVEEVLSLIPQEAVALGERFAHLEVPEGGLLTVKGGNDIKIKKAK